MYVPLFCKSSFSFLEGASQPEELIEAAAARGFASIALTDRDGVYGIVEAHVAANEAGVKLIVGSEISIDDGSTIVLLATTRAATPTSAGSSRSAGAARRKGRAWSGGARCTSTLPISSRCGEASAACWRKSPIRSSSGAGLKEAFGDRLYAMAARHRRAEEPRQEARLRQRAAKLAIPIVAAHEVLYHTKARRPLQDVFTALRYKVKLSDAGRLLKPNDEHALKTPIAFARLFEDDPAAVARTDRRRRALHVLARPASLPLSGRAAPRRHDVVAVAAHAGLSRRRGALPRAASRSPSSTRSTKSSR